MNAVNIGSHGSASARLLQLLAQLVTQRAAIVAGRARLSLTLRTLVAMLMIVLSGPLSTVHAALHDAGGVPAVWTGIGASGELGPAETRSQVSKQERPASAQHQRCTIFPTMHAIPAGDAEVVVLQAPISVTYGLCPGGETAKFAPPPLRKPPRN